MPPVVAVVAEIGATIAEGAIAAGGALAEGVGAAGSALAEGVGAVGSAIADGAGAAGSAIADGVGSVGSAISDGVSGMTLGGLSKGAAIAGMGMTALGSITGNKTLTNIGMGIGIAGGAGMLADGLKGMNAATALEKQASQSTGLLQSDNIENALVEPTKGTDFKNFTPTDTTTPSINAFKSGSNAVGSGISTNVNSTNLTNPTASNNFFQNANATLTKYSPMLNVAGGMGQAYMINQNMQLQRDLQQNQLGFDQQLINRVNTNNGTVLQNVNPLFSPGISRNPDAYAGILRIQ